eukprot:821629-Rhodomonas_salina.1
MLAIFAQEHPFRLARQPGAVLPGRQPRCQNADCSIACQAVQPASFWHCLLHMCLRCPSGCQRLRTKSARQQADMREGNGQALDE